MGIFSDRLSRKNFGLGILVIFSALLTPVIYGIVEMFSGNFQPEVWVVLFLLLVYTVFIFFYFALLIRRSHDLGYSSWLSLLACVPLVNAGFLLYLLSAKGTEGSNLYGDSNTGKLFWGSFFGTI